MNNQLIKLIKQSGDIKYIFCDYYDTVVHRKVHPLQPLRIWAKFLIRDFGMDITIDELTSIRKAASKHLVKMHQRPLSDIAYPTVIKEVYQRLKNSDLDSGITTLQQFIERYKEADFRSESSVQFLNDKMISTLKYLKNEGYRIFCVSDFYFDTQLMQRLIEHHKINNLFDEVFISSSIGYSKENKGEIYTHLLEKKGFLAKEVFMIGDNKRSDFLNSRKHGINAYHLKERRKKWHQKTLRFGSDRKDFIRPIKKIEKELRRSGQPYAEYLLIFHFFVERLYKKAKEQRTKNLFFLAREGLFLMKMFEAYQNFIEPEPENRINAHYLKISRQGAMQISFKPIEDEDFYILRNRYANRLSLNQFLTMFLFEENVKKEIADSLNVDGEKELKPFLDSQLFAQLIKNQQFLDLYERNRLEQKSYFDSYIDSFGVDFETEGMHVVDIGWIGSMQECLSNYFNRKYRVQGYYLGLRAAYDIDEMTKRYGLIFSVYPSQSTYDLIMLANKSLMEQFLAAPHGSTLGYRPKPDFTIEYHKKEELKVFNEYIGPLQKSMFSRYDDLLRVLRPLIYDEQLVNRYLIDLKMRSDLLANKKKIVFVDAMDKNFYNNLGNNKVGITYGIGNVKMSKLQILKKCILVPEEMFIYFVKLKPFLYRKNLYFLSFPVNWFKPYFKFHQRLKQKFTRV
ncbi:HAD hydrolase-like protein [Croceitalea marina]|uniref:HAD hydrolase-like protein n=1 Tax=Croceitalea marina TaxID=1775166 RepID=A0ABW5MXT9_9FLAO